MDHNFDAFCWWGLFLSQMILGILQNLLANTVKTFIVVIKPMASSILSCFMRNIIFLSILKFSRMDCKRDLEAVTLSKQLTNFILSSNG